MNIVPRQNTPTTAEDAQRALEGAWLAEFGRSIDREQRALVMALIWIETGRGRSVQNHNLGNISAGSSFAGDAWRPTWFELGENPSERDRDLHEKMKRGQAPSAFRAYASTQAGAADLVRRLRLDFPEVVTAAGAGDAEEFRRALSQRYSRDYSDPATGRTLQQLQLEFGGGQGRATRLRGGFAGAMGLVVAGAAAIAAQRLWRRVFG